MTMISIISKRCDTNHYQYDECPKVDVGHGLLKLLMGTFIFKVEKVEAKLFFANQTLLNSIMVSIFTCLYI